MSGEWVPLDSAEIAAELGRVRWDQVTVIGDKERPLFALSLISTNPATVVVVSTTGEAMGIFVWKSAPGDTPITDLADTRVTTLKEKFYRYAGVPNGPTRIWNSETGLVGEFGGTVSSEDLDPREFGYCAIRFSFFEKGDLGNPDGILAWFKDHFTAEEVLGIVGRDFRGIPTAVLQLRDGLPRWACFANLTGKEWTVVAKWRRRAS